MVAHPPRYWWLKRVAAAVVLALLGLGVLRWVWGSIAERRMAATEAEVRAMGEPWDAADFATAPIPADQNAALLLNRAAEELSFTKEQQDWEAAWPGEGPLTPADLAMLKARADRNREAVALVRRGRQTDQLDWGIPFAARFAIGPSPSLYSAGERTLGSHLRSTALYAHATGDDREAAELLRDAIYLWRAVSRKSPEVTMHLLSLGMAGMVADTAVTLADPRLPPNTAARDQVEALIADLLDERAMRESFRRAFQGERIRQASIFESGPITYPPWLHALMEPSLTLDANRMVRRGSTYVEAAGAPNYVQSVAALPVVKDQSRHAMLHRATRLDSLLGSIIAPSYGRTVQTHFLTVHVVRAAAVALALRLYREDHAGDWPQSLADLVPKYLPAIPEDPFDPAGGPIRYRVSGDGAILWSVGPDGVDQDGDATGARGGKHSGRDIVTRLGTSLDRPAAGSD